MVQSYKKYFPDGKFAKDINSLPPADAGAPAGPAAAPKPDVKTPAKTNDATKK